MGDDFIPDAEFQPDQPIQGATIQRLLPTPVRALLGQIQDRPSPGDSIQPVDDPFTAAAGAALAGPAMRGAGMAMDGAGQLLTDDAGQLKLPGKQPLNMETLPRQMRAIDQGFDPTQTWYHGSDSDIKAFKPSKFGDDVKYGKGVYLTNDPQHAEMYTTGYPDGESHPAPLAGGNITPAHLSVQNPLNLEEQIPPALGEDLWKEIQGARTAYPMKPNAKNLYLKEFPGRSILELAQTSGVPAQTVTGLAEKHGFDSIQHKDQITVFDPKKIRSKFAEFDPAKRGKSGLSFASGGVAPGDFIPDARFTPDPAPSQGPSPAGAPASQGFIPDSQFKPDDETFGTPGQQFLTGVEGAAQGVLGPVAPAIERAFGANPENIRLRAETNPWAHGVPEALTFGASALTGVGEAGLLAHAGEGAAAALKLGGEGANVGSKLAAGAAKMATEMGIYQAGDEASKAILSDPNQSAGSAISNVALSTLLGGGLGAPFAALGMGAKSIMNSQILKDFTDRLAFRGANINPNEMLQHEVEGAINGYHEMGSEVGGANGIKSAALKNILPEMSPKITEQAQGLVTRVQQEIDKLGDDPLAKRLQSSLDEYSSAVTPQSPAYGGTPAPDLEPSQVFDATNRFKQQLQDWSKFSKLAPPPIAERDFISSAKSLSHDFRTALEDPETWGKAAELQTKLNDAWHSAIKPAQQIESKFMSWVGNERKIDPVKFNTYVNQAGRVADPTNRQQIMKVFADAMEKFQDATSLAYDRAGIPNPHPPIGMTSIRESLGKPSVGMKLADTWHDKIGAHTMGAGLGGGVGGLLGHATGIPEAGFAGAYLGRWALGPVFSAVIKPMMERGASLPAVESTLSYAKSVLYGTHSLTNAAASVFGNASKTVPALLAPAHADLEKMDDKLKEVAANPSKLMNVAGNLGDYMPDHAQAVAQTVMGGANYLNSQRPSNPKQSPLDADIPVSKAQNAPFYRSLAIAERPLLAFKHIADGTLLPQDVKVIQTVYPAYYKKMSQELASEMTTHLSQDGHIPYKVRQSMSLFLGQTLDSTMAPQNIQSIQAIYAQGKASPQQGAQSQGGKPKGSPSKLGKMANNLRTPEQARADRANQG